jgi:CheY-like chemotaxis protein
MKVLNLHHKNFLQRSASSFRVPKTDTNLQPLVLVAEDHEDTRSMLCTLLKHWGFRVTETDNGRDAVEISAREKPAIIVMDIVLPVIDGLQAAQQIRQSEKTRSIPIVFVTGYIGEGIKLVAQACGGDEFLEKPFNLEELRSILVKYCSKVQAQQCL